MASSVPKTRTTPERATHHSEKNSKGKKGKIEKLSTSSASTSTLKVSRLGQFTITIANNREIIADDGKGNRFQVEMLQGSHDITADAIATDQGHVETLAKSVCDYLENAGLLKGKEASLTFTNKEIQITGEFTSSTASTKKIENKNLAANPALQHIHTTIHPLIQKIKDNPNIIKLFDINRSGDCLPASLAHQMNCGETQVDPRSKETIDSALESSKAVRQTVSMALNNPNYVNRLLTLIKDDNAFDYLVRETFTGIMNDKGGKIFNELSARNLKKFGCLKNINFRNITFSKLTDEQKRAFLKLYIEYIKYETTNKDGSTNQTYMDPLFMHIFTDYLNQDETYTPKMKILIINEDAINGGYKLNYQAYPHSSTIKDDDDFQRVYFLFKHEGQHYESAILSEGAKKDIIRKHQDTELNTLFKEAGTCKGKAGVAGFIDNINALEKSHPNALAAIKSKIASSLSIPPGNVMTGLKLHLEKRISDTNTAFQILDKMGITLSSIQAKVNKKRGIKKSSSSLATASTSIKKHTLATAKLSDHDKSLTNQLREILEIDRNNIKKINNILKNLLASNSDAVIAIEKIIQESNNGACLFKGGKFSPLTEMSIAYGVLNNPRRDLDLSDEAIQANLEPLTGSESAPATTPLLSTPSPTKHDWQKISDIIEKMRTELQKPKLDVEVIRDHLTELSKQGNDLFPALEKLFELKLAFEPLSQPSIEKIIELLQGLNEKNCLTIVDIRNAIKLNLSLSEL